ncbi:1,4-dihydroxy-2-naphthoyl-CoA synthase [bacterium HR19]|nr:1,4-dihydroxy-2-naphthoyl-CoA synthase [bacterium HR19]
MQFEDIIYQKDKGIATLIINRPEVLNAFRTKTIEELSSALEDAGNDRKVGVIVIKGAGEKAFCVGGDIQEMKNFDYWSGRNFLLKFLNFLLLIRKVPKPVICAVKGYCLGGGNEINISCDLTIATEDSIFGQVGPKVGSVPVIGGTQFLPRIVGEKKAREMVFLCNQYSAYEALQMGLINKVVPREKFDEEVNLWCQRILELSPQALRIAKLSFNFESDQLYPSFLHAVEILSQIYDTEEFKEGMNSFLEKRKPDFSKFRR